MRKIILLGGGGHCKACIDVIECTGHWQIQGILDPKLENGDTVLGYPILGDDATIAQFVAADTDFLVTVGQIKTPSIRIALYERVLAAGGNLATVVSPHAYVSSHASIGRGSIIMHRAIINAAAQIGANNIINTAALLEHDAVTGAHCHIATAAVINGGAQIGEKSFVGSNATLHQGVIVAENAVIAAGSVYRQGRAQA